MNQETSRYNQQKKIIEEFVKDLMLKDESLYYAPTIDICRLIHERIQSESLNDEQKDLLGTLSPKDIQIFLSYSSCC